MSLMTGLRHLQISCGGRPCSHRYRRSVVHYALISLRIAVELAPLPCLERLSLLPVHPAAVLYLQPGLGYGASPGFRKRWLQIKSLAINMASFPRESGQMTDHFKLLYAYLQSFSQLRELVFHWEGERSRSPFSLPAQSGFRNLNMPLRNHHGYPRTPKPLRFPSLQRLELANAIADAKQVAVFFSDHRHSLRECNFQDIILCGGQWDEALAPLTRLSKQPQATGKQAERGGDR